jgi:hypothetical protein
MHNCEEFREQITEHIIDREDLSKREEFQRELLMCSGCSDFYAQSREMMDAISEIDLSVSDSQWHGVEQRLQARILNAASASVSLQDHRIEPSTVPAVPRRSISDYFRLPIFAASAALLIVTAGLSRLSVPVAVKDAPIQPPAAVYVEHTVPLDPGTVDFLQQSELLLRNVMKIGPSDADDLADAKKEANQQLAGLEQRKEAAAEVKPVVEVIDTYETVLRDIRNVDERNAGEDISDIQRRIKKNALIANMKAYQPRVTQVSFGLQ